MSEFAERSGLGTSAAEFEEIYLPLGYTLLGVKSNEHDVFLPPEGERILKVTKTETGYGAKSRLVDYLKNLLLANIILGDDFRLEHIILGDDFTQANLDLQHAQIHRIVISQPYIAGNKASENAIAHFWENLDFFPHGLHAYSHACGTIIGDARPDNVFASASGEIFPIDVQILHGERYLRYMLISMIAHRRRAALST